MRRKESLLTRIRKANRDYDEMVKDPSLKYERKGSYSKIFLFLIAVGILIWVILG